MEYYINLVFVRALSDASHALLTFSTSFGFFTLRRLRVKLGFFGFLLDFIDASQFHSNLIALVQR
jgi:hypothetical protein